MHFWFIRILFNWKVLADIIADTLWNQIKRTEATGLSDLLTHSEKVHEVGLWDQLIYCLTSETPFI